MTPLWCLTKDGEDGVLDGGLLREIVIVVERRGSGGRDMVRVRHFATMHLKGLVFEGAQADEGTFIGSRVIVGGLCSLQLGRSVIDGAFEVEDQLIEGLIDILVDLVVDATEFGVLFVRLLSLGLGLVGGGRI